MSIDFQEKCRELKKVIIASYDWDGTKPFDERLEENLKHDKELRKFYNENFRNL